MTNYLVIRLSAIGDVAMSIPVIYSVAKQNPADTFTVLTQNFLRPLFINRPQNVEVIGLDIKTTEKRIIDIIRFTHKKLSGYDVILDLHDVLRTRLIRTILRIRGKKVYVIDKARKEKKEVTRKRNKILRPLRTMVERYGDVFRKAGLNYTFSFTSVFETIPANINGLDLLTEQNKKYRIGIAPFAKHDEKIYPLEQMEEIISSLSKREDISIFLFGGKGREAEIIEQWAGKYPHVISLVGRYSLDKEIAFMSQLDLFISMDSANMHFASLANTRVLSLWGATHPFTGFYGVNQQMEDAIQIPLECRPCSVFGQKPCFRGDRACMFQLSPQTIIDKVNSIVI